MGRTCYTCTQKKKIMKTKSFFFIIIVGIDSYRVHYLIISIMNFDYII